MTKRTEAVKRSPKNTNIVRSDDIVGKRFGMLTVDSRESSYLTGKRNYVVLLLCKCDCGSMVLRKKATLISRRQRACCDSDACRAAMRHIKKIIRKGK